MSNEKIANPDGSPGYTGRANTPDTTAAKPAQREERWTLHVDPENPRVPVVCSGKGVCWYCYAPSDHALKVLVEVVPARLLDAANEARRLDKEFARDQLDNANRLLDAALKVVDAAKEMMRVTHKGAKYATDPETCSNPVCTALAAYDAERKSTHAQPPAKREERCVKCGDVAVHLGETLECYLISLARRNG